MQTIYETEQYQIDSSILGVLILQKMTDLKAALQDDHAELFLIFYEENLHIIPPSAIDTAMNDLCAHYFRTHFYTSNNQKGLKQHGI